MKKKNSRKWLEFLQERAWLLSEGRCPEPDSTYWAGFAHALGYVLDPNDDIYAVRGLQDDSNFTRFHPQIKKPARH